MEQIKELLPGLDDFLRNDLAREKLSAAAEKRRKYYVTRLDSLRDNPPSPPPRPDGGLMKIPPVALPGSPPNTSFLHSSQAQNIIENSTVNNVSSEVIEEPPLEENIYHDMEDGDTPVETINNDASDMYLAPADSSRTDSVTGDTQQDSWSDSDVSIPYDDDEENIYDNIATPEDVPLPRVSKTKKKKKDVEPELFVSDLTDILFRGDIYYKGSWQWNKRFAVISNNRLLIYKAEKAPRPLINIVLLGYSIAYLEKEGRRNHVIRISHPNCESHFFSVDLKEIADLWLDYLHEAAYADVPSSGDSINLTGINVSGGSTAADQHSTSTGSEGGSGDGVVSANTPQQQQQQQQQRSPKSGDDKKQAVDKKKKNIISDFLSGTFGKKKSQKQAKKLTELSDIVMDPQARVAGVLDVCHETLTKGIWCPRYCCIKDGELECYHEKMSDGVEMSFSLLDVDIQSASKETKKDLSVKLSWENGDYILLDNSDTIEQGKWLHALIMEREGIKDNPESIYENQDITSETTGTSNEGDAIYDDIYDVQITTGKGDKIDEKTAHALSQLKSFNISPSGYIGRSALVCRSSSNVSDSSVKSGTSPPPLPTTDPPKRALPVKKRRSRTEDEDGRIIGENEVALSDEMATAFINIKSQFEKGELSKASTEQTGDEQDGTSTSSDNKNIIKCHLGPTIAKDKELLECTQNSILSVLREGKRKGSISAEALNEQIDNLKQELIKLKKQKSELRSKILTCRGNQEKQRLEDDFQNVEQMADSMEQEVIKLQLLAQEKSTSNISRNGSFSSPSSSRSSSLQRNQERAGLKSSPRGTKVNTNVTNKLLSNGNRKNSVQSIQEKSTSAEKMTTSGAASMSKSWAKATTTTSNTTKQAIAKFDSSPAKRSASSVTKQDPAKGAPRRTQSVTTGRTSQKTGSPPGQKSQNIQNRKLNGDSDSTKPQRVVKEKLKLWESMAEGSNH